MIVRSDKVFRRVRLGSWSWSHIAGVLILAQLLVSSVMLVFVLAPPRGHRKVSIEKESHFLDKSSPVPQDQPVARSEAWISGSEAAEGSQTLGTLAWNLGLPWKIHLLAQQTPFRNLALC